MEPSHNTVKRILMKIYTFNTEHGNEVTLETQQSNQCYFEVYVTCKEAGIYHKFISPEDFVERDDFTILTYSSKLRGLCKFSIPENIFTEIKDEYLKEARNCGKYIMAKIRDETGKIIATKIGKAVAVVYFTCEVRYRMPKNMEDSIRALSHDDKIYERPGIEVEATESICPLVSEVSKRSFYFSRFHPKDPFSFIDGNEESEFVTHELTLEIIDVYQE